jgi:hypothetical protein
MASGAVGTRDRSGAIGNYNYQGEIVIVIRKFVSRGVVVVKIIKLTSTLAPTSSHVEFSLISADALLLT